MLVDEAYADFADPRYHSIPLLHDHPNLIVSRSFSKGYSLAGIRLGYLVARPEIVEQLVKVKDSYNCDLLSQVAGVAALEISDYLAETRSKVLATRAGSPTPSARCGYQRPRQPVQLRLGDRRGAGPRDLPALKERKILVRLMSYPGYPEGLRISVGTDEEIDRLLDACANRRSSHQCRMSNAMSEAERLAEIARKTRETDIRLVPPPGRPGPGRRQDRDRLPRPHARALRPAFADGPDRRLHGRPARRRPPHHRGRGDLPGPGDRPGAGRPRGDPSVWPRDPADGRDARDRRRGPGRPSVLGLGRADAAPKVGTFDSELVADFWQAVATQGRMNLHVLLHHGRNTHHVSEAIFKASARAAPRGVRARPPGHRIPSTKGTL